MTRPIKFRCWDKKDKLMRHKIEGRWWVGMDIETGELLNHVEGKLVPVPEDRIILLQFTGLLDRQGKEIYEGDVVGKDNTRYEIRFVNGCFVLSCLPEKGFWLDIRSTLESMEDGDIHYDRLSSYEVIGNCFEHKHLIQDDSK